MKPIATFRTSYAFLFCSVLALCSCVTGQQRVFYQLNQKGKIDRKTMELLLWENPLNPADNMSITNIVSNDSSSYHLVQIRGAETPHIHRYHDAIVFLESGTGILHLGKQEVKIKTGASILIEHGTPHYFVNTGPTPAIAIAVFSPPYDGQDNIPVTPQPDIKQ